MKLIFENNRLVGPATDDHVVTGSQILVDAPEDFDMANADRYRWTLEDGVTLTPLDRHITNLAFDNRFTIPEAVNIEMRSIDDPTASEGARAQAATLRVYQRKVDRASYIDLDRPDTRAYVEALEAGGILGTGRALQILDAAVMDIERPKK